MNIRLRQASRMLTVAALAAVVATSVTPQFSVADEKPTLRELTDTTREKVAQNREATLRKILSRQKGDQLKIYLRDTTGMFVNGTSVSTSHLSTIIREAGLKKAVITTNLSVTPERVAKLEAFLQKEGVKDITKPKTLTPAEIAIASREKAARDRAATLRLIVARQKGDELKVYLNSRGSYINGKSVSTKQLATIVKESGLDQAVLTAESYLPQEKVAGWTEALRKAGIKNTKLVTRKQAAAPTGDAKVREILARQKGNELKVYLKDAKGLYVNGKSVSLKELTAIATALKSSQATISAEPVVSAGRVQEITALLQKSGVEQIKLSAAK